MKMIKQIKFFKILSGFQNKWSSKTQVHKHKQEWALVEQDKKTGDVIKDKRDTQNTCPTHLSTHTHRHTHAGTWGTDMVRRPGDGAE